MYIWSSSIRSSTRVVLSSLNAHTDVTTRTAFVSESVTRFRTTAILHSSEASIISTSLGSSWFIRCEYSTSEPRLSVVSITKH